MIAMKIMIVEDEENIRDGIRNLVDWNQEGFEEPLLFSSAVEALVFLETETVDVVLTDLYMPVLNGIEFIRMLREQNQVCEVIILTGHERFEGHCIRSKAVSAKAGDGADAFNRTAQSQPGNSRADEVKGLGRYCEEKAS